LLAALTAAMLPASDCLAEQPKAPIPSSMTAASEIADFFSQVGDQIYENCIFDLSEEQIEVQQALVDAYVAKGASGSVARQLAAQQIQPPKLSDKCEQIRSTTKAPPKIWDTTISVAKKPAASTPLPKPPSQP